MTEPGERFECEDTIETAPGVWLRGKFSGHIDEDGRRCIDKIETGAQPMSFHIDLTKADFSVPFDD